jgi:hypothetical protein
MAMLSHGFHIRVPLPGGIFTRHRRGGSRHQTSYDSDVQLGVSDNIFELASTYSYGSIADNSSAAADDPSASGIESVIDFSELEAFLSSTSLTSSTTNDDEFDILRNRSVAAVVVGLCAIVIVLGSVGSLLVILSIARSRLMWTATNVFIANLALSDLFVCAIDLPITLHYQVKHNAA